MKAGIGVVVLAAVVGMTGVAMAGDAVAPASVTYSNRRSVAVRQVGGDAYYDGSTLRFTNCIAFQAGNVLTQGLDGVAVEMRIGIPTDVDAYTATVYSVAGGTSNAWWYDLTMPSSITGSVFLQIKLIDENTNTYYYPQDYIAHKVSL